MKYIALFSVVAVVYCGAAVQGHCNDVCWTCSDDACRIDSCDPVLSACLHTTRSCEAENKCYVAKCEPCDRETFLRDMNYPGELGGNHEHCPPPPEIIERCLRNEVDRLFHRCVQRRVPYDEITQCKRVYCSNASFEPVVEIEPNGTPCATDDRCHVHVCEEGRCVYVESKDCTPTDSNNWRLPLRDLVLVGVVASVFRGTFLVVFSTWRWRMLRDLVFVGVVASVFTSAFLVVLFG